MTAAAVVLTPWPGLLGAPIAEGASETAMWANRAASVLMLIGLAAALDRTLVSLVARQKPRRP